MEEKKDSDAIVWTSGPALPEGNPVPGLLNYMSQSVTPFFNLTFWLGFSVTCSQK